MSDILPIFSSHYSITESTLTLEEAGKTKSGNPASICDLAQIHHLQQVTLVDTRIDGFLEAYKNLSKINVQLIYGLKLCVCADINIKDDASLSTESNVIVFIRNTQGYNDLLRIQTRAWTDGFYYRGRIDWKGLCELWTPNLLLALPFFSSFIQRNSLTLSTIVPQFPVSPKDIWVFREIDSGIPFVHIIDKACQKFALETGAIIQDVKSIYYAEKKDFKSYMVLRAIGNRSSFDSPHVEHLSSNRFCFESCKELTA